MGVEYFTERFTGPLDLLLHLIQKNEIDIADIPISLLADQYLERLSEMQARGGDEGMDSMSEFVLMAATLLEIKSRTLLPSVKKEGEAEEDPRAELARSLLEYSRFKAVLDGFREREGFGETVYFKGADPTLPLAEITKRVITPGEALGGVSAERLLEIFMDVLNRREEDASSAERTYARVAKEAFTVAQMEARLVELLGLYGEIGFYTAFGGAATKLEKIVTFLALLELIRTRRVIVTQDEPFGAIVIAINVRDEGEAIEIDGD